MWSRGSNPTSPFPLFPTGTTTLPRCPHHLKVLFSSSHVRFSLVSPLLLAAALYLLRSIPKVVTHPPIGYHGFGNSFSFLVVPRSNANFCTTVQICIEITNNRPKLRFIRTANLLRATFFTMIPKETFAYALRGSSLRYFKLSIIKSWNTVELHLSYRYLFK